MSQKFIIPDSKKVTCKICHYSDYTGGEWYPSDLDSEIHKGFTIGKGKQIYWMMCWHGSGNVTVFTGDEDGEPIRRRYLSGDTEITIHFK